MDAQKTARPLAGNDPSGKISHARGLGGSREGPIARDDAELGESTRRRVQIKLLDQRMVGAIATPADHELCAREGPRHGERKLRVAADDHLIVGPPSFGSFENLYRALDDLVGRCRGMQSIEHVFNVDQYELARLLSASVEYSGLWVRLHRGACFGTIAAVLYRGLVGLRFRASISCE